MKQAKKTVYMTESTKKKLDWLVNELFLAGYRKQIILENIIKNGIEKTQDDFVNYLDAKKGSK